MPPRVVNKGKQLNILPFILLAAIARMKSKSGSADWSPLSSLSLPSSKDIDVKICLFTFNSVYTRCCMLAMIKDCKDVDEKTTVGLIIPIPNTSLRPLLPDIFTRKD